MRTWTHMEEEKTQWGPGPWDDEPDKAQWIDETTGLDCLIVRNHHGTLCGYVGVPPEHPDHGKDYDEVDVDVHGGLTFAGMCDEEAPEGHGICHIPEPGRPPDVYWLGFDCGHFMDLSPGMIEFQRQVSERSGLPHDFGEVYRDIAYVRSECEQLAQQLAGRTS